MDILRLLPKDSYDAAVNAASPSAANPFATMADIPATPTISQVLTAGHQMGAGQTLAVGSSGAITFDFSTFNLAIGVTTLSASRTQTFQDADGVLALTTDSLATSSNLQTVLTNGNATGTQDILFSDGRYAKFSDGGSFTVNVKGPATVTTADKTVLFKDANGTVALTSDISGTATGITQTYSSKSTTHAARTYSTLTDSSGGTTDGTVAAVSGSGDDANINNNFAEVVSQLSNLASDQQNTAQVLNELLDQLQAVS